MRYIITSSKFTGELEIRFNAEGVLCGFDNRALLTSGQLGYFITTMRQTLHEKDIQVFKSDSTTIKMIPDDLTFEHFWKRYNHKVGHKKKAETMWSRMTDAEKMKAIAWIGVYDNQRTFLGVAKLYPESYLQQKRYLSQ